MPRKAKYDIPDAPPGSGERFRKLAETLRRRGATDPEALAARIGRKKYGKKRFAELSAKGRRRKRRLKKALVAGYDIWRNITEED